MNIPTPSFRQLQLATLITCLLAFLFFIFFNASKHDPALVKANVFIEDPFDAVGSFGIQLALLAGLISFVRILRPYPKGVTPDGLSLIFRGDAVALLSIVVTLAADLIAMLRYLPGWTGSPAGWRLAGFAGSLGVLTAMAGWLVLHLGQSYNLLSGGQSWGKTIAIFLAGCIVLAVYPEAWRRSVPGAIFTALVGMVFLLVLCSALAKLVFPTIAEQTEDFLDDLFALYQWIKARARSAGFLFRLVEKAVSILTNISWARRMINWLNPRKHAWNVVFLAALAMGVALIFVEATGEGLPQARLILLVFGVFLGLEGTGVILGYALFRRFLRIFRAGETS